MPTLEELAASVERLTKDVSDRDTAFGELKETHATEIAEAAEALKAAQSGNGDAQAATIAAYRGAVAKSVPGTPPELIVGDTVEEIDASLAAASALVGKIKAGLAIDTKVPPGAPSRQGPSMEGLHGEAKIAAHLRSQQ